MKFLLAALLALAVGWELLWAVLGVKPFGPWRHADLLALGQTAGSVLDVRTAAEYRLFRIPGAQHRPGLLFRPEALDARDPAAPVVVVCMTGHRSPLVAYRLRRRGFQQVYHLTGGMLAWKLTGGPTVSSSAP
jgi:rhodanese-related sulfurtransferase